MPCSDDPQSRRKNDVPDADAPQCLRILAVDDDPAYLRYLSLVLGRAGFAVETAVDGAAAIVRIRAAPRVDLLLIDLSMPGFDGIETVRRIHLEIPASGLYTILLTASTDTDVKLRALDGGLDAFLTKTSSEPEIIAKIRSAARRLELERQLHLQNEELQTLALTDELTDIANRRALFRSGNQILSDGRGLSVVLFDLDRFKEINDTHGHLAGDRVLREVASRLKLETRYGDMIGRYGGDEFVLLLPDTSAEAARQISDRIMVKIRQPIWTIGSQPLPISAQCGIATAPSCGKTLEELIAACDQKLYRSKRRVHGTDRARDKRLTAR